jgi:thiamine-phosphate pyrophosphorylase
MKSRVGRLHVITDTVVQSRHSHAALAALAIGGGADTIQYRSKSQDFRTLLREAGEVGDVCRNHGVTFLVNDRVDLCLAVDADGVHLGREDMPVALARKILGPEKIIGGTIRNAGHLEEAVRESADYVGLGPIFSTSSKSLPLEPLGLEMIRQVSAVATIPLIAIAGIDASNAADVIAAGAYGIAVIGAVCCAEDVTAAAAALSLRISDALSV